MVLGSPRTAGIDGAFGGDKHGVIDIASNGTCSNPGGGDHGATGEADAGAFGATGPENETLQLPSYLPVIFFLR